MNLGVVGNLSLTHRIIQIAPALSTLTPSPLGDCLGKGKKRLVGKQPGGFLVSISRLQNRRLSWPHASCRIEGLG